MAGEADKYDANAILYVENTSGVDEYEQDYLDNKVCVWETAMNLNDMEAEDHDRDNTKQCDISTVGNIKTELSSPDVHFNMINENANTENETNVANVKIEYKSEVLLCDICNEEYQDFCTKCGMLIHILNRNDFSDADNKVNREMPKHILEIRDSGGVWGIFALKVIPEGIRFGPFTGLDASESLFKIKEGKFVVHNDKSELLNWMQFIKFASNIVDQNLVVFQYEDNIYYGSNREIREGEELLVYFGEEYIGSLNVDVEMDFVAPIVCNVKDVFACTFCCLGFSSWDYLVKHKGVCPNKTKERFLIEELSQCQFCKIYLEEEEYLKYHMTYCQKNVRKSISPALDIKSIEIKEHKSQRRQMYTCKHCKYKTIYKGDLKNHTNKHYQVKTYKCATCSRRFKKIESLKIHMQNIHIKSEENDTKPYRCSLCEFQTENKYYLKNHIKAKHLKEFNWKCETCEYKACTKANLLRHIKRKHHEKWEQRRKHKLNLKKFKELYKCAQCDYKVKQKKSLTDHIRMKHLNEFDYKCELCEYKTNNRATFDLHIKSVHLKQLCFKCEFCEYKANRKVNLQRHIKIKHLKEFNYNCELCNYKTIEKLYLESHIKTIHLKEYSHKCDLCDFKTNNKFNLKEHIRTKHLHEFTYKCDNCDYKTNHKSHFKTHVKRKHSKEADYKCTTCDYKAYHKSHIDIHIKTVHLEEYSLKCEFCVYRTNLKSNLNQHVRTKHLREFYFKCEICEFQTNKKQSLEKHIKAKHIKEFDYKCENCDYKTNHKGELTYHVKLKHLKEDCTPQPM